MKTAVFLYHHFSEYELSVILSVLKQGERTVVTVGLDSGFVEGEAGLTCKPDMVLQDLAIDEVDAVVLPGVDDAIQIAHAEELFSFIQEAAQRSIPIAAICSAPVILAKAGVLNEHRYTTNFGVDERQELGFPEVNYVEAPLVRDGSILTAKGSYFIDFGVEFGKMLKLDFSPRWYR